MSGKLAEIKGRIKAVVDTQQITKAMKMVAAAKLRRAQEAIIQMRPYVNKMEDIMKNILPSAEGEVSIALAEQREVKNVLIILITSNRGLCGAFNSTLIKLARKAVEEDYSEQATKGNVQIMTIGKKGMDVVKKWDYELIDDHQFLINDLSFAGAVPIAESIIEMFENKEIDVVRIMYSQFKNAATQIFTDESYLPLQKLSVEDMEGAEIQTGSSNYIFEPNTELIVNSLVPFMLKAQLYKVLLDNHASEHGARMIAMDKATDNAEELLGDLRLFYNRARQEEITKEISEIVGGAAAQESA